jgi:tetratricopeptide (TPR) repeat protein
MAFMKPLCRFALLSLAAAPLCAQMGSMPMASAPALTAGAPANERLGTVVFPVSCAASTQPEFNRGVALLHDFWYEEARAQFQRIERSDPACAMAPWGVAMSAFHQIWDRPNPAAMKLGWAEMQKAVALKGNTPRERAYIAALAAFYRPGDDGYPARIAAYSDAMGSLYRQYPDDVDAGAFYALSLLAAVKPGDTSLAGEHQALAVLQPLFAKDPDNPGVDHYIIHACDNPAMAAAGLAASDHYLEIAQSGPHAYHMPGHIYARLGLWRKDIPSQIGSIEASEKAETLGESGIMDEPHSYDFLVYAYLQTGQNAKAKSALDRSQAALTRLVAMPGMGANYMAGMVPYYRVKMQIFYDLELRDWKSAAALQPVPGSSSEVAMMVDWARAIAHGRLHEADAARSDLAKYDASLAEAKAGPEAYRVEGNGVQIERGEMLGWTAFAEGKPVEAAADLRKAADLQDKVGQGEVDIPAREMLADLLLESGRPKDALAEYEVALRLSPNRLNGLYNAGRAAEASGDKARAQLYFAALVKSTGKDSERPEVVQAEKFLGGAESASR